MDLTTGTAAPDFSLPNAEGEHLSLTDFRGKWLVLYAYPKDNTPGCTLEANAFSESFDAFTQRNATIVGVSPDSAKCHQNFIRKHTLRLELLSDPEHELLEAYGVWKEKSMYGRSYMGVERSTFLIDPDGQLRKIWRNVKVKGHAEAVLLALDEFQSQV
jgi:peroxiredoxin Q/BCP